MTKPVEYTDPRESRWLALRQRAALDEVKACPIKRSARGESLKRLRMVPDRQYGHLRLVK